MVSRFTRHLSARQGEEASAYRFPVIEGRCKKDTSHMVEAFSRGAMVDVREEVDAVKKRTLYVRGEK